MGGIQPIRLVTTTHPLSISADDQSDQGLHSSKYENELEICMIIL